MILPKTNTKKIFICQQIFGEGCEVYQPDGENSICAFLDDADFSFTDLHICNVETARAELPCLRNIR